MTLDIIQIPVLNDNYIYLLIDEAGKQAVVIDPALAPPVLEVLKQRGVALYAILNTHHHGDHTGGNLALREATGCRIYGYGEDAERIAGLTDAVQDGDSLSLPGCEAQVLYVPGHTRGHIAYYIAQEKALFCGDTLFSLGCGRLFEGTPAQMYASLMRLSALPEDTRVYCAHEYTESNGRFALTLEPDNAALHERMQQVSLLRAQGRPTVPSLLGQELKTNPFLRVESRQIRRNLDSESADNVAVFAEIRRRKDQF